MELAFAELRIVLPSLSNQQGPSWDVNRPGDERIKREVAEFIRSFFEVGKEQGPRLAHGLPCSGQSSLPSSTRTRPTRGRTPRRRSSTNRLPSPTSLTTSTRSRSEKIDLVGGRRDRDLLPHLHGRVRERLLLRGDDGRLEVQGHDGRSRGSESLGGWSTRTSARSQTSRRKEGPRK